MKCRLVLLITLCFFTLSIKAQSVYGEAMEYTYVDGYRVKRQYNSYTLLNKPGKDNGNQADTVFGLYREKDSVRIADAPTFVKAYPNPVKTTLFIENLFLEKNSSAEVRIHSIDGKEIFRTKTIVSKESIDLSGYIPGNYNVSYYVNGVYMLSWKITKL